MSKWGGPREGAGRKPKEPGQKRVTLSTRISGRSSENLRAYAERTGKTLSQVIDEFASLLANEPFSSTLAFEPITPESGRVEQPARAYQGLVKRVKRTGGLKLSVDAQRRMRESELEQFARVNEAQRQVLESILQACPAGLLYLDRDLFVRWVNPAYLKLRRRSAVEYLNRHLFLEVSPNLKCDLENVMATVMRSGEPYSGTNFPYATLTDEESNIRQLNYSVLPVFGEGMQVIGVLLCVQDTH